MRQIVLLKRYAKFAVKSGLRGMAHVLRVLRPKDFDYENGHDISAFAVRMTEVELERYIAFQF